MRTSLAISLILTLYMQPGACAFAESAAAAKDAPLAFRASGAGEFVFDTGVFRGKLRGEGKSTGLSSVFHIPTGARLDSSMGLFSFYRVFNVGKRYGVGAWDWASTATLKPDGSVEVVWPSVEGRPFELRAIYRWSGPGTLDLETRVQAERPLPGFECFLASYFSDSFTNSMVCAGTTDASRFLSAEQSDGIWQAFPRDDGAVALIKDGRWKLEPHPVDWVIRPRLAHPIGVRQSRTVGVCALLMARPEDCFAIFTPHNTEPHYSTYISLFGTDLKQGQSATARARMVLGAADQPGGWLASYQEFSRSHSR